MRITLFLLLLGAANSSAAKVEETALPSFVNCGQTFVTFLVEAINDIKTLEGRPWLVTVRKSDIHRILSSNVLVTFPFRDQDPDDSDLAELAVSTDVFTSLILCLD